MGAVQSGKMEVDWQYLTKVSLGRKKDLYQCHVPLVLHQLMQPAVGNSMAGKLIRFIGGQEQS